MRVSRGLQLTTISVFGLADGDDEVVDFDLGRFETVLFLNARLSGICFGRRAHSDSWLHCCSGESKWIRLCPAVYRACWSCPQLFENVNVKSWAEA